MAMSITDNPFFSENLVSINKLVSKLLLAINAVPIVLCIFTYLGLFSVDYNFVLKAFCLTLLFSVIHLFLVYRTKLERFTLYFGLLVFNLLIAYMGTNSRIGIYISFSFTAVISSLYYEKKVTYKIIIISYLMMIASLYFKSKNIVLTGDYNPEITSNRWFFPIAVGFTIEYIFVAVIVRFLTIRNYKTLRHLMNSIEDRNEFVKKLDENNKTVVKINQDFEKANAELKDTQFKIIQFVAECLGSHDLFTGRHVLHTKTYVEIIAKKLCENGYYIDELTEENISLFSSAAFLHDIGKIHIPEGVLNKVGKFTDEEFELMKNHPGEGKKLLEFLPKIDDGRFNEIASEMAYCHHEKWDGKGYPRGISGEDIPLCARIMAAADVLDALISQRLYKDPMSVDQAMEVFEKSMGSHFEPCIAEAVIDLKDKIEEIDKDFKAQESEKFKNELDWWRKYHGISS